jgi:hypothetical protein
MMIKSMYFGGYSGGEAECLGNFGDSCNSGFRKRRQTTGVERRKMFLKGR